MLESPEQATPAWVTAVLRAAGRLAHGSVVAVDRHTTEAFNSTVTHLHLTYSDSRDRAAPPRLILKLALPQPWAQAAGATEVAFYQAVSRRRLGMLARCVAAEHDPETGRALLLLDDLDLTHEPATTRRRLVEAGPLPPAEALDGVIEALAGLHNAWWEVDPPAGVPRAAWLDAGPEFPRWAARSRAELDLLLRAAPGRVSRRSLQVAEETVLALPHRRVHRVRHRASPGRWLTVVHGDCYLSNWLLPRPGVEAGPVAVDFQQVHQDSPGEDLAFLLGTFLTPAQRARHETRCLHRYLECLGRDGYRWPELLDDYRWALERMVVRAVWEHSHGSPDWYWRPKLERVTAALTAAHRLG